MFKLATLHPYRKRTASQKCCFKILKPKSLIGSNISQFHTPFSKLISSNILGFIDRLFLNLFKLVWHQPAFCFLITCLVILIWVLSTIYCLIRYSVRGASWAVRFLESSIFYFGLVIKKGTASPPKRVGKDIAFRSVSLDMFPGI